MRVCVFLTIDWFTLVHSVLMGFIFYLLLFGQIYFKLAFYPFNLHLAILLLRLSPQMIQDIIQIWEIKDAKIHPLSVYESTDTPLWKCKFRPKNDASPWNVLATIDDNGVVALIYINDKK